MWSATSSSRAITIGAVTFPAYAAVALMDSLMDSRTSLGIDATSFSIKAMMVAFPSTMLRMSFRQMQAAGVLCTLHYRIEVFSQIIVAVLFDVKQDAADVDTYRLFHVILHLWNN